MGGGADVGVIALPSDELQVRPLHVEVTGIPRTCDGPEVTELLTVEAITRRSGAGTRSSGS